MSGTFDVTAAQAVIRYAAFAADQAWFAPGPPSGVPGPDGSVQPETGAERLGRTIAHTVSYLLETGLLILAPDVTAKLAAGCPVSRPAGPPTGIVQ